jgi:uncharacterized protein (TIGR02117 family)
MQQTVRAIILLLLACLGALVAGAVVPQNGGWQQARHGVTIHLAHSAIHTELVLPVAAAGHDWRSVLPLDGFADGRAANHRIGLSWGERDFFLATPTWADFDPVRAARALLAGDRTLVHLYRMDSPGSGRPITLSPAQYRRLVAHLEASIAPGEPIPGYGKDDLFLPAHGRYSLFRTCNQWTRDALAAAGVRVGRWTPLPQGLLWRFEPGEWE